MLVHAGNLEDADIWIDLDAALVMQRRTALFQEFAKECRELRKAGSALDVDNEKTPRDVHASHLDRYLGLLAGVLEKRAALTALGVVWQ